MVMLLVAAAWGATCPPVLPAEYADDKESSGRVVLVAKADHAIGVYEGDRLVPGTCFDVRLGSVYTAATADAPAQSVSTATDGPKLVRGDMKTPEGWYKVSSQRKKGQTDYYKGLAINYPNYDDAMRAVESGLATYKQLSGVFTAIENEKAPPQDTVLGGDILIHGNPNGSPLGWSNDWTWGCVALETNAAMDVIYGLGIPGTAVLILPALAEETKSAAR